MTAYKKDSPATVLFAVYEVCGEIVSTERLTSG